MDNPTVHMMVGLPGSGKSSFIKLNEDFNGLPIFSFDQCVLEYSMTYDILYEECFKDKIAMKEISKIALSEYHKLIHYKRDFIIDMTNLSKESRKRKLNDIPIHYRKCVYVMITSKDLCWDRQTHNVPRQVFNKMSRNFTIPEFNEGFDGIELISRSLGNEDLPTYIIDIDGTIADISHRLKYLQSTPKDYINFYDNLEYDKPITEIIDIARLLRRGKNQIILVSGRPDSYMDDTIKWLRKHRVFWDHLFMRCENDFRDDTIVKEEILKELLREGFNPILAIDDRPRVVRMWRKNGIKCLALNDKEF